MQMIRWAALTLHYNQDHEILQHITVYPEGVRKEEIKKEHRDQERVLLVRDGEVFRLAE